MTEYKITVEGVESGLTKTAVMSMVLDAFPHAEAVEIEEVE